MYIDLEIPKECLEAVCTSGDNESAVHYWFEELGISALLDANECRESIYELGYTITSELDEDYKKHAFWNECWSQYESMEIEQ